MPNVMTRHSQGCENLYLDLLANLLTMGTMVMKVKDIRLMMLLPKNPKALLHVMMMAAIILGCDSLTANSRNVFPGANMLKRNAAR